MRQKVKVLFIKPSNSSFIENDLRILKNNFIVREIMYNDSIKKNIRKRMLLYIDIIKNILWCDVIFSWFGGYHTYSILRMVRIFNKKTITVIGGYEVANIPKIKYGSMNNKKSRKRVEYIINNSTIIIAVSKYILNKIKKITNRKNIELVYNTMEIPNISIKRKKRIVATVGFFSDMNKVKLKGLDVFLECAKRINDATFLIIGVEDEIKKELFIPKNVIVKKTLKREQVLRELSNVKVYCQFSMMESFGMATLEAMSLNCIPIVSDRGALPEIVSEAGYVVPYGDIEQSIKKISDALDQEINTDPRKRVETVFNNQQKVIKYNQIIHMIT